jgi:hypothetical protein
VKHRNLAELSLSKGAISQMPSDVMRMLAPLFQRLAGKHMKRNSDQKKAEKMINYNDDCGSQMGNGSYSNSPAQTSKPSDREWGTNSSVDAYSSMTPGQSNVRESAEEERNRRDYKRWRQLVNMGAQEIQAFLDSQDGKKAGLSRKEASTAGAGGGRITSGRDSARAIIRMKSKPFSEWDASDIRWMRKQINFISRMRGNPGKLRDEQGRPTRKLLALKVWGHNPGKS